MFPVRDGRRFFTSGANRMAEKLGIIGDTHSALHPRAVSLFQGVARIIHTGDAGGPGVLNELEKIAPVTAVRGNYDTDPETVSKTLSDPSTITIHGYRILLTHRLIMVEWSTGKEALAEMFLKGGGPPFAVFFGHTHVPVLERVKGIWFVNPGYSGPDPLEPPPTAALVEIGNEGLQGEIVEL